MFDKIMLYENIITLHVKVYWKIHKFHGYTSYQVLISDIIMPPFIKNKGSLKLSIAWNSIHYILLVLLLPFDNYLSV